MYNSARLTLPDSTHSEDECIWVEGILHSYMKIAEQQSRLFSISHEVQATDSLASIPQITAFILTHFPCQIFFPITENGLQMSKSEQ